MTFWFRRAPMRDAKLRLLCFPYAGAGANVFRAWSSWVPGEIEVVGIDLPGRGIQFGAPPEHDLADLLQGLIPGLFPMLDAPYALFGHSMGALVAFELARELCRRGVDAPTHLFVSGFPPPHCSRKKRRIHELPQPQFVSELAALNGTPAEVLGNDELLELLLPTLRADIRLVEEYAFNGGEALPCPITVYGGLLDPSTRAVDLSEWGRHTRGACEVVSLPGDHYFIHRHERLLVASLLRALGVSPIAGLALPDATRGEERFT